MTGRRIGIFALSLTIAILGAFAAAVSTRVPGLSVLAAVSMPVITNVLRAQDVGVALVAGPLIADHGNMQDASVVLAGAELLFA